MKVKGAEPIALVTTHVGRENVLAKELENALFLLVENLRVIPYSRRGVVLVLGIAREDFDIVSVIKSKGVSRAAWIIPIDTYARARYEYIKKAAFELVVRKSRRLPLKIVCKCRRRGFEIDSCSRLCRFVGLFLESLGLVEVDFRRFEYVLRIEVLDESAFLSLYSRSDEGKFRCSALPSNL